MKKISTSDRLKEIMRIRNLRQVDILEMSRPYCKRYNVKLSKSDLSQYLSGHVVPGQEKLSVLGMALDVNEAWLMGYAVPIDRNLLEIEKTEKDDKAQLGRLLPYSKASKQMNSFNNKFDSLDEKGKHTVITVLEMEYNRCKNEYLEPTAAHPKEGAIKEDIQNDLDIMDDDNF